MVRTSLGAEFTANVDVRGAEDVVTVNADTSTTVPDDTLTNDIIRPPDGFIYELLNFRVQIPPPTGATTGFHDASLFPESEFILALFGQSNNTTPIEIFSNTIETANRDQTPSTEAAQTQTIRGLRASPSTGFKIRYQNRTDVDQTNQRQIRLLLRRIEVERV